MPSTYSNSLRLELQADNENQGNWGSVTNRNLGTLLESAVSGVRAITLPDTDYTLSALNGSDDEARYAYLVFNGTLTATRNVIVPAPSKLYAVRNGTNHSLIIKTSTGTGVTVPSGASTLLYSNGTNVLNTLNFLTSVSTNVLSVTGALTAQSLSGDGAGLTNLNASNLAAGTVANARTTGTSSNTGNALVLRDASGNFSAGTITASLNGNANSANTAVNLSTNRTNWSSNGTISAVVGQLAWKNFGNGHTIFDASQSTSPDGGGVNNTNAQIAWTPSYPTLMGWNGGQTYGVRVDSARRADSAASVDNGVYNNGGTYGINITGNAETVDGFSASQSTVGNHIVVRDGNGYIFGNYINMSDDGNPGGGGGGITSFITKQGDNFYRSVSVTAAANRIRDGANGTWPINITGSAGSAPVVIASSRGGNDVTGSGYIKLADGTILQWTFINDNGQASVTGSWPIAFPVAIMSVQIAGREGDGVPRITSANTVNFTASWANRLGNSGYIWAIGY